MSTLLEPSDPPMQWIDGNIAYTDEGTGEITIVAVPGLPGSSRDFRYLAPALSDRFRVIRLDPPGYGASPRTSWAGMTTAQRADSASRVMAQLGVTEVVLVGHSAGGAVVAHLARNQPELVKAAVMISSTGPTAHFARLPMHLLAAPLRLSPVRAALAPVIRRLYSAQGFPRYLSDDERAFALLDAAAFNFADHRANLAGMRAPTLVAWAHDDPVISADTFRALSASVPDGPRLEFPDGAHNVQKTHAREIAQAITDMVREIP
jgi:pimeloyl-ACP methyl ester carboxylesterase